PAVAKSMRAFSFPSQVASSRKGVQSGQRQRVPVGPRNVQSFCEISVISPEHYCWRLQNARPKGPVLEGPPRELPRLPSAACVTPADSGSSRKRLQSLRRHRPTKRSEQLHAEVGDGGPVFVPAGLRVERVPNPAANEYRGEWQY